MQDDELIGRRRLIQSQVSQVSSSQNVGSKCNSTKTKRRSLSSMATENAFDAKGTLARALIYIGVTETQP